jgi:recombinational DNA repair protein RecR
MPKCDICKKQYSENTKNKLLNAIFGEKENLCNNCASLRNVPNCTSCGKRDEKYIRIMEKPYCLKCAGKLYH